MNLADLLSGLPRDLFETILAVFFGTYVSKQVFRTSLPAEPRPTLLALPRAPACTPATLLLDPPLPVSGIPTSLSTRNKTSSLLNALSSGGVFEDNRVPAQDVEAIVYSIVVLVFYLAVLAATTYYASHQPSARPESSPMTISQLYEFLAGRPYASTRWECVLDSPDPRLNWYFASSDAILNLDASLDPEPHCTPASDTFPERPLDECSRYVASLDADRLDAFAAYLLGLGYTDLRIQADDITPSHQATSSSAVTVDFRFTARSVVRELVTRTILRFVLPSDVPMDRTDFMMWDLGDGWVRAFEVGLFEMAVLPVDEDEEQRARNDENLDHLTYLPFHFGDDETDENLDRLMCTPFYLCEEADEDPVDQEDGNMSMAVVVDKRTFARVDRVFPMLFCGRSTLPESATFIGPHTLRQTRTTAVTILDFDTPACRSDTSTWLLDSFSEDRYRRNTTSPKLLTASSMSDSFIDVNDAALAEIDYGMESSWCEQHMFGSQMEESILATPLTDDEMYDFVVVPNEDIQELASSTPVAEPYVTHSPEAADPSTNLRLMRVSKAAVQEERLAVDASETELSVCSLPEAQGNYITTPDYLDEPQYGRAAAVEPLGHDLPASTAVTEHDFGIPVQRWDDVTTVNAPTPTPDAGPSLLEGSLHDLTESHLPSPQISAPMDASVGTLVDAALNSVISPPVAERNVDLAQDLAACESFDPMIFKTPSVYVGQLLVEHVSKALENSDVEGDSPTVFGPALPPVDQI